MPGRAERLAAAQTMVDVQMRYARLGRGMAQAALAGAREVEPLRHYPSTDVVDARHASQFYYHAHPSRRYPAEEHGHFHLFVRPADGGFHHLAGCRWMTEAGRCAGSPPTAG